jgi:hypothetical protein
MQEDELKQLTQEVKETLDTNLAEEKSFGTVDLWNVQRQMKSASRFSRRWELS